MKKSGAHHGQFRVHIRIDSVPITSSSSRVTSLSALVLTAQNGTIADTFRQEMRSRFDGDEMRIIGRIDRFVECL